MHTPLGQETVVAAFAGGTVVEHRTQAFQILVVPLTLAEVGELVEH